MIHSHVSVGRWLGSVGGSNRPSALEHCVRTCLVRLQACNGVSSDVLDMYKLKKHFESDTVHAAGLIISNHHTGYSHWNSTRSLDDWLGANGVPGICGIDTRALVKKIREDGEMKGKIIMDGQDIEFDDVERHNLIKEVSCQAPKDFRPVHFSAKTAKRIIAIDCGISNTMIRMFMALNIRLRVVPWDYDIFGEQWDGLFVSGGPDANPDTAAATIASIQKALALDEAKPILAVGVGSLLLARAAGAQVTRMHYGNRGHNQPCVDMQTGKCYITSQNHGYTIDNGSLPEGWQQVFMNLNDRSNEGIAHESKPFMGVNFVPGSDSRPTDIDYIVKHFYSKIVGTPIPIYTMPYMMPRIRAKCLMVGSPGLGCGETGQHDAMGLQAIEALRDANIEVVLLNPNVNSVQASPGEAESIYFMPVTPVSIKQIVQKEKVDCIIFTHGGETAMECGRRLQTQGFYDKYNVEVLGTPLSASELVDNRDKFAQELAKIDLKPTPFETVKRTQAALSAADKLGYPVQVRMTHAVEGTRQYYASDAATLRDVVDRVLMSSESVVVEKSLQGWKEVGYEVLRDRMDNCISVCDMENLYPLGSSGRDSIMVVPSHTLVSAELGELQVAALKLARQMGVIGSCHVRFALFPGTTNFYVTNMWMSLSSTAAFASRATGYALGYVSTKLSLGSSLTEVQNPITTSTTAFHEPTMDHCAICIPVVPPAVGADNTSREAPRQREVLAFGVRFSEAMQKALRMAYPHVQGLDGQPSMFSAPAGMAEHDYLEEMLTNPSGQRIFAVYQALKAGWDVDDVYDFCKIDRWFLQRINYLVGLAKEAEGHQLDTLPTSLLKELKCCGCSDTQIGTWTKADAAVVRSLRKKNSILPGVRQVDTTAGEYPTQKEILYVTYNATSNDVTFPGNAYLVIGTGSSPLREGCELDWCVVSCLDELKAQGRRTIVTSCNPRSVATDFERSDRLYFEEVTLERILDITDLETPEGVITTMGGAHTVSLTLPLAKNGVPILGSKPSSLELLHRPTQFSELLNSLGTKHLAWSEVTSSKDALAFAEQVQYPCMTHRSFYGGLREGERRIDSSEEFGKFLSSSDVSATSPLTITQMLSGAQEIEMDAVARDGNIVVFSIIEHIQETSVHAGDATLVLPAQKIRVETSRRIEKLAMELARALNVNGLLRLAFHEVAGVLYLSQCQLCASRTLPFTSKVLGVNFAKVATQCILNCLVKRQAVNTYELEYVAVKAPVFNSTWECGLDPHASDSMVSTGAVASFGLEVYDAFLMAIMGTGFTLPPVGSSILLSTGEMDSKMDFLESAQILDALGYTLYGTSGTHKFYSELDVDILTMDDVMPSLKAQEFALVINIPTKNQTEQRSSYLLRRAAVDHGIPLITNLGCAKLFAEAVKRATSNLKCISYSEYINNTEEDWIAQGPGPAGRRRSGYVNP